MLQCYYCGSKIKEENFRTYIKGKMMCKNCLKKNEKYKTNKIDIKDRINFDQVIPKIEEKSVKVMTFIWKSPCWKCKKIMKKVFDAIGYSPEHTFTSDIPDPQVVHKINEKGLKFELVSSKITNEANYSSICPHCKTQTGSFHLQEELFEHLNPLIPGFQEFVRKSLKNIRKTYAMEYLSK